MPIKRTSSSFVAQSFIVVATCVAAPFFCASSASADISGFVTAWGRNSENQCTIPAAAQSGVSAITGGAYHTIALKDGAVLAWGNNDQGQCAVPTDLAACTAVAGGFGHSLVLTSDPLDRNNNGIPDSVEISNDPTLDRNSNGIIDLAEITALTAQLNCGDLNGDGEVNGGDLGKMLISWGLCQ